jgi:hypothetical protein
MTLSIIIKNTKLSITKRDAECHLCIVLHFIVYCQDQIKLISDIYLQVYKTLEQFTSSFTLNANLFTSIKVIKIHIHIFTQT